MRGDEIREKGKEMSEDRIRLSRLEAILQNGDDGIIVLDRDRKIGFVNEMAEELTGYRKEDLLGDDFLKILDDRYQGLMEEMMVSLDDNYDQKVCTDVEISTADGMRRECQLSVARARTGTGEVETYTYLRDITARKAMERTIRVERDHLQAILESLVDGVYIANVDRRIDFMNKALISEFGDGRGQICYRFFEGRETPCPTCHRLDIIAGKAVRTRRHHEATGKIYDVVVCPLRRPDGMTGLMGVYRDVTAWEEDKSRARTSEEQYRTLFESVQQGIYISTVEGKFDDCNPALLNMLGYDSKEEFLQIDITRDLYLRPSDRDRFQEIMAHDGGVHDFEVEFKRKDGTPVIVMLAALARRDKEGEVIGYEGLMVDITELKKIEQQLREKSEFLNNMIQASMDAIIVADMKGNILVYNKAAERILGYTVGEALGGMHITNVYPAKMAYEVMRMMRGPEYGGPGKLDSLSREYQRKDGTTVACNLSAALIHDDEGREMATVGVLVDLTERLGMEKRLRDAQEKLLRSEKLAAMGRLTSQVAHEINNPLYGIINTLELLRPCVPEESRRKRIHEMAISEGHRLADLIRKMLSLSKPAEENRRETDMAELLGDLLLFVEKQMKERGIEIASNFVEDLPRLTVSPSQMRQVFLNLLQNARDAMSSGGTVTVSAEADDGVMCVDVNDTGQGIREDHLDKVFEAFFTTKDKVKGVGLGLSLCYSIIKDHGGDITVKSEPGKGSTFTVMLPVDTSTQSKES